MFAWIFLSVALLGFTDDPVLPPAAKRVSHVETWHGERIEDPYFWLREKQSKAVTDYLHAENAYTAAMTWGLEPLADRLYNEMVSRVQQSDLGVPVRMGAFEYYSRTIAGAQYPIYCRRAVEKDAEGENAREVVLLDPNAMAVGQSYLGIGGREVSDDDRLLAYSTDTTGFRQYALHIKDIHSGEVYPDTAERVTSFDWAADSRTLFFVTEDAVTKRSNQLWRMTLGQAPQRIFEEADELFSIGVTRTRDKRYVLLQSFSTDTWETRLLSADQPEGSFEVFLPREKGHKYTVAHHDGVFFVRTNRDAVNFRLVRVSAEDRSPTQWKEVIAARGDTLLRSFEVFATHGVATEQRDALTFFRVLDFKTDKWNEITFPEAVYAASAGGTPEYNAAEYRVHYQSMVTPPCVYDYDLATLERKLRKQDRVLGGFDSAHYATERVWAHARDGVKVPISLVYREGVKSRGPAPLWLYAYGSYGASMPASFNSDRLSLLDRGIVFAIAHIRGGNDMGEAWHTDGMLMKKRNTFTDFIDCAEHLIGTGWTRSDRLVIEGGSAGGLLMGAVVNLRPDLFRAVHAAVPFVDVVNTMMDASLPLTVGEYLEWGNPNEKPAFEYIKSYSPYDNLRRTAYPAMLVTTSFNDSQVMYWEPAKYVAKLRTMKTDTNPLIFKCKMEAAGHGGASGRYDRWKDKSFEYAWMLSQLHIRD